MSTDTANAGKLLIAFVAGAVVAAIGAASMWPKGAQPAVPHAPSAQTAIKEAEAAPKSPAKSDTAFCKIVSNYARMVMESRQKGVPMADMMEISEKASPDVSPALKQMIVAAFEEPRMAVAANQDRRIRDFENDAYLSCIKG